MQKKTNQISVKVAFVLVGLFLAATTQAQSSNQGANMQNKKILIAYFTRAAVTEQPNTVDAVSSSSVNAQNGALAANTESVAKTIQGVIGGDLFRVETQKRYPWNYRATTDMAMAEQKQNARPVLTTQVQNFDSYDVVFIGYPSWWGTLPMALFTFLESYNFAGKTIIPFCTHEGSGLGSGVSDIKELSPRATVLEGLAVRGSNSRNAQNDINVWLRKLGMGQ